jgi:hypothetical protein
MSTEPDLGKFEREVRRLEESLGSARAAAERAQRTSIAMASAVAVIVVTFLLINYLNFRAELTAEKLAASFGQELKEARPAALREFGQLGQELLPVYAAEWQAQFQSAWPAIRERISSEMALLADNAAARVDSHLNASERHVLDETRRVLVAHFPEFEDPKAQAAMTARVQEICEGSFRKALDEFHTVFVSDMTRLQRVIAEFELPEIKASTVDLQKKFLRLWLQIVDQEIMQL